MLGTPGAEVVDTLVAYVMLPAGPRSIAIGCIGGKHRACGLVEILAARLREHGQAVDVDHRRAHLPRVLTK
ncbi:hypothetical protein ACIBQ6_48475 [Nonomuraea sp. NPDC049655]|uniref:RapZ C-terminal domain-containing protein n=1 Tax=Nonomuraea sp. NPDC049655 TaxID=3364355 RepID=UPI0037B788DC